MGEKVDEAASIDERQIMQNSGKLLIFGILAVALMLAAAGWWFRYTATHRAARFWGPHAVRLIRDAPEVTLQKDVIAGLRLAGENPEFTAEQPDLSVPAQNVSHARGLTHLRNALLEDRSFQWPKPDQSWPNAGDFDLYWALGFHDPSTGDGTAILFSEDCRRAARLEQGKVQFTWTLHGISTEPIAAGLREMFGELSAEPAPRAR